MADSYIDPFETLIYGKFAREQLAEVCLGRVPELDAMVHFVIAAQERADAAMKLVLDREPKAAPPVDAAEVLEETRDVVVRFGAYLESLKGRPVDPKLFFRGDAPSVMARRRLTKLAAGVRHVLEVAKQQQDRIENAASWIAQLEEVVAKLDLFERQQRAIKVEKVELGPELGQAREAWLRVYVANKHLIRGLLAHAGKPELMPLVFDDLSEVQRARGVTPSAAVAEADDQTEPEPAA